MTRNSVVRGLHNPVCLLIVGLYNVVSPRTVSPYLKICLLRFGTFQKRYASMEVLTNFLRHSLYIAVAQPPHASVLSWFIFSSLRLYPTCCCYTRSCFFSCLSSLCCLPVLLVQQLCRAVGQHIQGMFSRYFLKYLCVFFYTLLFLRLSQVFIRQLPPCVDFS